MTGESDQIYPTENSGSASTSEEKAAADASAQMAKGDLEFTPTAPQEFPVSIDWSQMTDEEMMARAEKARLEELARQAAEAVVKHVWTSEDTYASLAQKYYGSFQEPYWRLIYNHNKAIIGNHPNAIREGLEIEIPPLPDELKKK